MDRMRRVMQLWDWLPAFRAVAETEHLTQAAHQLRVTPPALSRTLKILEQDIQQPLFDREGRSLVLNPSGRRLLASVRAAMRLIHDALLEIESEQSQPLIVASSGIFTVVALEETLFRLLESYPHILPDVRTAIVEDPASELLQGRLDLLFTSVPPFQEGLTVTTLHRSTAAVFCGPGHPLHGRAHVSRGELAEHLFVAPPRDPTGAPLDAWPVDWPRRVGISVDRQALGLALCRSGRLLGVFPDVVSAVYPELSMLLRVPVEAAIFAVHRRASGAPGPVEAAVDHAKAILNRTVSPTVQEK